MSKNFYITTTLPYVNAEPHIGFGFEIVTADIIARYRRDVLGEDVFFNTGTDEHGTKILKKSTEEGIDVKKYVDEYAEKFRSLKEILNLDSNLNFIRTTDEKHIKAAQEIWKRAFAKGDIYKKKYKGLYCIGDEAFVKETDLVNGKCPNHPNMELQEIEEENYFFKLSNYKEKLKDYLNDKNSVLPEFRREEAILAVEGMDDFSISRDKSRLSWGIPVPDDENQVMYVWFDALTNYISTLGWPESGDFEKFWHAETLQLAGKDQVKFQSVIWQAMLMSADIINTKKIIYHGFINVNGQKMSKSLGNVVNVIELVEKYGTDVVRHFLSQHVHPFDDTDFTEERFLAVYNGDLKDTLGNNVSRIMQLAEKYLETPVSKIEKFELPDEYMEGFKNYRIDQSSDTIWRFIRSMDEEIANKKPFSVIKENKEEGIKMIVDLVNKVQLVSYMLQPFMPETAKKITEAVLANKKPENLFPPIEK